LAGDLAVLGANQGSTGPIRWMVLFSGRAQPLLVPDDAPQAADAAIAFFVGRSLLRLWARVCLLFDHHWSRYGHLPRIELKRFPADAIFNGGQIQCHAQAQTRPLALLFGSPGPLQKLVVLRMGATSEDFRVAKLALRASADDSILREMHWLRLLNRSPDTARFVPRLLHAGSLACGRHFVVMNALPGGSSGSRFDTRHRDFLAVLGKFGQRQRTWRDAAPFVRLQERCRALSGMLTPEYRQLMNQALLDIDVRIGTQVLPSCLAHGDFAPWNVRLANGRLFVFDWEYAQEGANPLHDYLHFHLIARSVGNRSPDLRYLRRLMAQAATHANAVFGGHSGVADATAALLVHYLLDTVSFYAQESGHLDPDHRVLRVYLRLLAARDTWLAGG